MKGEFTPGSRVVGSSFPGEGDEEKVRIRSAVAFIQTNVFRSVPAQRPEKTRVPNRLPIRPCPGVLSRKGSCDKRFSGQRHWKGKFDLRKNPQPFQSDDRSRYRHDSHDRRKGQPANRSFVTRQVTIWQHTSR